jgi:hypothetical protein
MQEVVEEEEEEGDDGGDNHPERERWGGRRQYQDGEVSSGAHYSESSGLSHDIDNEDDENPRPAKRRRLPLASHMPLTHAKYEHLSTPVNDKHHYPPSPSRSPLGEVKSAPLAEYREWPFQGFLKRTTIGNQTIYNLEFELPCIPEHLDLSLHPAVLSASFGESSAEAVVCHWAVTSRKLARELTKNQESLLTKMVHEDKTWAEIGRQFLGYALQSLKDNFFTKQGGKPRKRGRKPGVRDRGA